MEHVLSIGYLVAEVDWVRCLVGASNQGSGQAKSLKGVKRRDGGGWWSKVSEKGRKKASVLYTLRFAECLVSDK
jgi:hypothetical protein